METHQLCLPSEFAPLRAVREMLRPHSPPRPVSGLTRVAERAVKPKAQGQWTLLSRHKGAPSFGAALPCVLECFQLGASSVGPSRADGRVPAPPIRNWSGAQ